MEAAVIIGILFSLLGSVVHQLGFACQKLSFLNDQTEDGGGGGENTLLPPTPTSRVQGRRATLTMVHRLAFPVVSAVLGTQSVIAVKVMNLAVFARASEGSFATFWAWLDIFLLIGFATSQLAVLNMGIARYEATVVFPVYLSSWIVLSSYGGAAIFGEFDNASGTDIGLFVTGVVLIMFGTALMCKPVTSRHPAI